MTDRETTTPRSEAADLNRLFAIYDEWQNLFPWNVPTLTPYREAAERDREQAARDFQDIMSRTIEKPYPNSDPEFLDVDDFGYWLTSRTRLILQNANERITEGNQAEQGATLAALYEAKRDHRTDFEEISDQFADPFILQGLREDFDLIRTWIADNIEYLESMGVQPQRAGSVEVKQTAAICALVYTIDRAATGETVPGKAELERDITSRYTQFELAANSIYKQTGRMSNHPTEQDCRRIAGNDWRRVVIALSNHPDKVKEYIENEIIKG